MPSILALTLSFLLTVYLLKIEGDRKANVTFALWIPTIWVMIIASRMVMYWLNPTPSASDDVGEGNPVDGSIFAVFIFIGIFILLKRKISWGNFIRKNAWLFLFFAFCGISVLWSEFPFITFKRFVKAMGCLIMITIILTESKPFDALTTVIRRCSYVLVPVSIVLIKYYPYLGRVYHRWTGELMITGVATTKNGLGALCMVCGLALSYDLYLVWRKQGSAGDKKKINIFFNIIILMMIFWLLIESHSATSLVCMIIGILTFLGMTLPIIKNNIKSIGIYVTIFTIVALILQYSLDIITTIIAALGRDATLTGRTAIWAFVLTMVDNPLIGHGFESFLLGDNVVKMSDVGMNVGGEVHNGYLEIYLDIGFIGLFLLAAIIFKTYKNIIAILKKDFEYGTLLIVFFVVVLFYNITESAFRPMQLLGFIFFLTATTPPEMFVVPARVFEDNS